MNLEGQEVIQDIVEALVMREETAPDVEAVERILGTLSASNVAERVTSRETALR